jgi:hypothetical protein
MAAMLLITVGAMPVYRNAQRREQERADSVLMEKVNAALSRPVPRALAPLLGN